MELFLGEELRVVKIIDGCRIVIKGGSQQMLSKGDNLAILSNHETEVVDPHTNCLLGSIQNTKGYVTIVDLFDNMSVCEKSTCSYEKLKIDKAEVSRHNASTDYIIRLGDLVKVC